MGYRGQDLDLRTPQTWRAAPNDLSGERLNGPRVRGPYAAGENVPIWVDDTVLACTNHAFDVALAHRSGEVRIEHLIHALTRIEDAAEVLEASGIRVSALRRDMATVIASDIPVGLANGGATPRSSDAFETVLRMASAHADQQNTSPASVRDLLYVMLDLRPAGSGGELIERHLVRSRERVQVRRSTNFDELPRERVRRPAGRHTFAEQSFEPAQFATDSVQNSRLDALEQMMRAISLQLTSQRDDTGRFSGGLMDRLQSLEMMVSSRQPGGLDGLDALMRRLDDIEHDLRAIAQRDVFVDLTPVTKRLDALERLAQEAAPDQPAAIHNRLDELDRKLDALPAAQTDLSFVTSRLDQLDWKVGALPTVQPDIFPVMQRIDQLDNLVRQSQPVFNVDLSGVDARIADLENRIAGQLDLGRIASRLDIIEEAVLGQDGTMSGNLDSRIANLEGGVSLFQTTIEDVRASLTADVREVAASLAEQSSRIARTGEGIADLVRIVEAERADDAGALADMAEKVEGFRGAMESLAVRLEAEQQSLRQDLAAYGKGVETLGLRSSEAIGHYQGELKEVHEALMKLNANQHTLAGSIDQWRNDSAGDLGVLATRIEGMEREAARPMALLTTLSGNMEQMHRLTVERYHRRNRFWYWLFGTDDWVAASWPSQAAAIEVERRTTVRPTAKR